MPKSKEVTIEEIERAMMTCALLVDHYGEEMQPMLDRLEREWQARRKPPEVDRIRAILAERHGEAGHD